MATDALNDKRLLELAAKAAGTWTTDFSLNDDYTPDFNMEKGFRLAWGKGWWNPLTDDGDAFRLAVKLKILVDIGVDSSEATNGDYICHGICELHRNSDPYAATRRAIVRAAAEIGKAK